MRFFKVIHVAKMFDLSRGKVYAMVKKGVLKAVNIDGCIRIPEEAIDEMIHIKGKGRAKSEFIADTALPGDSAKGEEV